LPFLHLETVTVPGRPLARNGCAPGGCRNRTGAIRYASAFASSDVVLTSDCEGVRAPIVHASADFFAPVQAFVVTDPVFGDAGR